MHVKLPAWLYPRPCRYDVAVRRYADDVYLPEVLWLLSRVKIPAFWSRRQIMRGRVPCSYAWHDLIKSLAKKPPTHVPPNQLGNMCRFLDVQFFPNSEHYNNDVQDMICHWLDTNEEFSLHVFGLCLSNSHTSLAQLFIKTALAPPASVEGKRIDRLRARLLIMLLLHVSSALQGIKPQRSSQDQDFESDDVGPFHDPLLCWQNMGPIHIQNIVELLSALPVYRQGVVVDLVRGVHASLSDISFQTVPYEEYITKNRQVLMSYLRMVDLRGQVDLSSMPRARQCAM